MNDDGTRKYPSGLCYSVGNNQPMMNVLAPWIAWEFQSPPPSVTGFLLMPSVSGGQRWDIQELHKRVVGGQDVAGIGCQSQAIV